VARCPYAPEPEQFESEHVGAAPASWLDQLELLEGGEQSIDRAPGLSGSPFKAGRGPSEATPARARAPSFAATTGACAGRGLGHVRSTAVRPAARFRPGRDRATAARAGPPLPSPGSSGDEPGEDSALNSSAGTSISEQKNQPIPTRRRKTATCSGTAPEFPRMIVTISGPNGTSTVRAKRRGKLAWARLVGWLPNAGRKVL
jgi:hypothetical protein